MACGCEAHEKQYPKAKFPSTQKSDIEATYIGALPVDDVESLPEFLLAERDVEDPATGNIARMIVRVPAFKIIPNGNFDNIVAIDGRNPSITSVEEGQVLAGYVKNETAGVVTYLADETHPAQFLIVGVAVDGQLLIQPCGTVFVPAGHKYIKGLDYWVGANGEPTTDSSSGCHLFVPISDTKLLVNIYKR